MPKCKQSHSSFIAQGRSTQTDTVLNYLKTVLHRTFRTNSCSIAKSEVSIDFIYKIIRYIKTVLHRTCTNYLHMKKVARAYNKDALT